MSVMEDNLILNALAWIGFHLGIGLGASRIPISWFNPNKGIYRIRSWEKGGKVYQRLYRVRVWKALVPNGSRIYPGAFSIKNLPDASVSYLRRWVQESCRAEFCHALMILPGFLFFIWNSFWFGCLMLAYALLNNLPLIALQRFNRPRVQKLLKRLERTQAEKRAAGVDQRQEEMACSGVYA